MNLETQRINIISWVSHLQDEVMTECIEKNQSPES